MRVTKDLLEKANTELAKRWTRILYLEDVVSIQNSVALRQASEILGYRDEIKELRRRLAEVVEERDRLKAVKEAAQ